MDELFAQLRKVVGDNHFLNDAASLHAYESDALTLFRGRGSCIVIPGSREEVVACVKLFHAARIPFVARGAGTGLSGGAVVAPGGAILAMSRMRKVLEVNPEEHWALVEPGVINAKLSELVAPHGLCFAPDPSSQKVCTLGGNVAENAGGPHCFLHGMTAQHVRFCEVVLPDGRIESWGCRSGGDSDLDLRGFLLGSEGTLGVITAIGVRLMPVAEDAFTVLAAYHSLLEACEATTEIVAAGLQPAAMEVMDQNTIKAVEDSVYRCGLPTEAGAVLLVELEGPRRVMERDGKELVDLLKRRQLMKLDVANSPTQRAALWKGRKGAGGALGRQAPDSYVMDGVVPRSRLVEIMSFVEEVQAASGLKVANLFHAGDGNIHPHFSYDARNPEQSALVEKCGAQILERCLELGGSLSGEHGIGLEKEHLLSKQFSAATLKIMERVRRVFNPDDLLNPGRGLPLSRGCAEAFRRHRGVDPSQA